jgi:acetyl-CoA C-acetyltransferase
MNEVYIVSAKRTPTGGFLGSLSSFSAIQLGAEVIKSVLQDVSLSNEVVDAVIMGNVLSANLGQSPARQAALGAGIPYHTDCTTINKVCASGLKAVMLGAQQIQLSQSHLVVSGGMESMSNAPHYIQQRKSNKLGDENLIDGLLKDGLIDAYSHTHMGNAAELCAREFEISRAEQDEYTLQSYSKATKATQEGKFKPEIVPIKLGTSDIQFDEDVSKIIPEKVPKLKPVFESDGTITAANASNLNDGAAAIMLASKAALDKYNLKPLARILSYADAAQAPERFTTSPTPAVNKALEIAGLNISDVDFFEINEAYAVVLLANAKLLNLDLNKVNVYGGAVAMGHPLGASGARILCTLVSVLIQENGRYGVVAICNGGGGASAMIIERV